MSEQLITKETVEVMNVKSFTPEQVEKIEQISKSLDVTNSQMVLQYGTAAQAELSDFADTILNQIKTRDTGNIGDSLINLSEVVKELDNGSLNQGNKGLIEALFGGAKGTAVKFIQRYDKLDVTIEGIVNELEKAEIVLLKDITLLDTMYDKNIGYLRELDCYIAAGEKKLKELNEIELPKHLEKAKTSNDPFDVQAANDFREMVIRFEKKLHDLKLSRMIAIQTAPQIRLVQNGDKALVEKIQSSIVNTIPLWKNQVVIAITILRQESALKAQQAVTDTTNELLTKNSELLKQNTLSIATESEKGVVEIETLKKVNDDLVSTIEETIKIQMDGRQKRIEAEKELNNIENELKTKLLNIKNSRQQ